MLARKAVGRRNAYAIHIALYATTTTATTTATMAMLLLQCYIVLKIARIRTYTRNKNGFYIVIVSQTVWLLPLTASHVYACVALPQRTTVLHVISPCGTLVPATATNPYQFSRHPLHRCRARDISAKQCHSRP